MATTIDDNAADEKSGESIWRLLNFRCTRIERKWSGDMKLGLIMLAAGNSRRFGSNKLLYGIDGMPMYRHILLELKKVKQHWRHRDIGVRSQLSHSMRRSRRKQRSSAYGFFTICIRMREYLPH